MLELFKNFCMGLVIIQLLGIAAFILMVAVTEKMSGDTEQGSGTGKHTLCALTGTPCIATPDGPDACEDCPAAQEYFYQEGKNGDKVRRVPDEGRTDKLP